MRFALATIATREGPRAAMIMEDGVVDIAAATGRAHDADMRALAADWRAALPKLDAIAAAAEATRSTKPLAGVEFLAPIANPGAVFCAGSNYADHAAEMAARTGRPAPRDPHELGLRSWHFLKSMHCIAGPDAHVAMHPRAKRLDWEAELAVVIGAKAFQVAEQDALDYVLGYTIANDLSARDLARREQLPENSSFKHDWIAHKNWDGSCPLGPWITLARDIPDPQNLAIELDVNGVVKQRSNSGHMIFGVKEQIADLSANFTLWPGDVILTGTPAGVGAGRGEYLARGDVVRVRIERIGELVTYID